MTTPEELQAQMDDFDKHNVHALAQTVNALEQIAVQVCLLRQDIRKVLDEKDGGKCGK